MEGKTSIIWTLIISVLVILVVLSTPFWVNGMNWGTSISIAGTILSASALIIALIQIQGLQQTNEAIKEAVDNNSSAIQRISNIYDIAKHTQMISEIHGMVTARKWDMAHLRLLELYNLLGSLKKNITDYGVELRELESHISDISDDLKALNRAIQNNIEIQPVNILNHLDNVSPLLAQICTQLKTTNNDQPAA